MSVEHNKALVQRFFSFLNDKEHVNVVRDLVANDCLVNGQPTRISDLQDLILMLRTAFPNERVIVETCIAEGEYVAVRLTSSATHTGHWCSPLGVIPPTGKPCSQSGMHFFRISGGRIVELWTEWNVLGQLQQLGVVQTPDLVEA